MQVQIIATPVALAAMGTDEGPEVTLIGTLVLAEAGVTGKAVDALLGCLVGHGAVKGGDAQDHRLHIILVGLAGRLVFGLMGVKPFAVIVFRYLAEKGIDVFHIKVVSRPPHSC